MSFNVGDIVRLKSGSPKMTVVRNLGDERIVCTWFRSELPEKSEFPASALSLHKPPESPDFAGPKY